MAGNQLPIFFRYRLLWHLLFWLLVFFIYWLNAVGYMNRYQEEFIMNLYLLPARVFGTYTLLYLILPLAIVKKKFLPFGVLVFFHFLFYGFLIHATYYFVNPYPEFYDFTKYPLFNPSKIITKSLSEYVIPVLSAAIYIFKKWYIDEQKNKQLAKEKLAAELNFLKAQVHPHFLFNTLNNLYALTLIKSDNTPNIVLKLSDLLDYMIYKSNDKFVPLDKELEIFEGYIELEKMRYNDRLSLTYTVNGDPRRHRIAPLILLPFIENSFKHGASNDRMNPKISVTLDISGESMTLRVENSIPDEVRSNDQENNGIGLSNVKRRLELIYPNQHELVISKGTHMFTVKLKILWK